MDTFLFPQACNHLFVNKGSLGNEWYDWFPGLEQQMTEHFLRFLVRLCPKSKHNMNKGRYHKKTPWGGGGLGPNPRPKPKKVFFY
jgi:hypothetical protein